MIKFKPSIKMLADRTFLCIMAIISWIIVEELREDKQRAEHPIQVACFISYDDSVRCIEYNQLLDCSKRRYKASINNMVYTNCQESK